MAKINGYNFALLLVFGLLSIVGILNHEIWMDEAHHWLLARESNSVANLIYNTRYEGHPILWNLVLYCINYFTHNPIFMQLLNSIISIAGIVVFLRYAPFSRIFKTLFVFGYFTLYEYNIISRNYALMVLFIYLITFLYMQPRKNFILLACMLFLLMNTHLFGLIISVSFVAFVFIDYLIDKKEVRYIKDNSVVIISFLILAIGITISVFQIFPPPDSPFLGNYKGLVDLKHFGIVSSSFLKAFMPMPDIFNYHYWNTNLLVSFSKEISSILSLTLAFIPLILLLKRPASLIFFYLSTVGILLFIYITGIGSVRYFGLLYIVLIVSLWLASFEKERVWYRNLRICTWINFLNVKTGKPIIFFILITQAVGGLTAYALDFQRPFSTGKDVACYVKNNGYAKYSLITFYPPTPSVCSYLENNVYQLKTGRLGSYMDWRADYKNIDEEFLLTKAIDFTKLNKNVLLISYLPINCNPAIRHHFKFLESFNNGIIRGESFWLYKIEAN